jgi:hypothetical protein
MLSPEKYHQCWHWSFDKSCLPSDHEVCDPPYNLCFQLTCFPSPCLADSI